MTAPIRTSVSSDSAGTTVTSFTSPTLSGYHAHDLLVGGAYCGNASNQFNTYTWSNGDTNTVVQLGPNAAPSGSFNVDGPTSAGSTTFGFTLAGLSNAAAVIADLIPASASVTPTPNATSKVSSSQTGTGPLSITLGTYTTIANDCIIIVAAIGTAGLLTFTPSGAGATWSTITGYNTFQYIMAIGYGASSGQTSISYTLNASATVRYAVAVYSGVATSGATNTGNMMLVL